jgi:quercetin dioxygenase-like cupin family protein
LRGANQGARRGGDGGTGVCRDLGYNHAGIEDVTTGLHFQWIVTLALAIFPQTELMRLTRWNKGTTPSRELLRVALAQQGFQVSEWTDMPGTVYPVHQHSTLEVRWVVRGKLRVGIPEQDQEITLEAGDRLELDPNEVYWADVDAEQPVHYLIGVKDGFKI